MKLSIIIPVYNVELYLKDCLDSVIKQDLDGIEILCVEDCSTDNSLDVLEEYAKRDDRIKIIRNSVNKGLSASRNIGIRRATGEYVQFIDSDDFIEVGACRKLYEFAKANDADIVYFNLRFLNDEVNGLIREEENIKCYNGVFKGRELFCLFQRDNMQKPEAVRHFTKRSFIIENELFFFEGIIHEDILFSFLGIMKAERVCDLCEVLYVYRQRSGSISWGAKEKSASCLLVCLLEICSFWLTGTFSSYENKYISKYIKKLYKYYLYRKAYASRNIYYGNEKEIMLQKIIEGKYFETISFKDSDVEKMRKAQRLVLYGAGKIAVEIIHELQKKEIFVTDVVVSVKNNTKVLAGLKICEINELIADEDVLFIIGTGKKYRDEICTLLRQKKYTNFIIPVVDNT